MAQEVEAKFRLRVLPPMSEGNVRNEIKQGYLDFKNDEIIQSQIASVFGNVDLGKIKEARIRAKGSGDSVHYYFTLKSDGTLQRDEFEEEISPEKFDELWFETNSGKVTKVRTEIDLGDGLIAEVDKYADNLEGLYTLEVEFDPEKFTLEQIVQKVQALDSNAENVTELKQYKNAAMAKRESLAELEEAVKAEIEQKMAEGKPAVR